jgi:hypothetical protein
VGVGVVRVRVRGVGGAWYSAGPKRRKNLVIVTGDRIPEHAIIQ